MRPHTIQEGIYAVIVLEPHLCLLFCVFSHLDKCALPLPQFEYYGSSCWSATFTGNSVKGSQHGDSMLRFASDGAVITWSLPTIPQA